MINKKKYKLDRCIECHRVEKTIYKGRCLNCRKAYAKKLEAAQHRTHHDKIFEQVVHPVQESIPDRCQDCGRSDINLYMGRCPACRQALIQQKRKEFAASSINVVGLSMTGVDLPFLPLKDDN